jgi:hypothetical protein
VQHVVLADQDFAYFRFKGVESFLHREVR